MTKQLTGPVTNPPPGNEEMEALRVQIRRLDSELRQEKLDRQATENQLETAQASIRELRNQLAPLHRAMKAVFGEIELAGISEDDSNGSPAPTAAPQSDAKRAVWESWKQTFGQGSAASRIIDALQIHKDANTEQLKVLIKAAGSTVSSAIFILNQKGLINKNGGRFSLKQI